MSSNDTNTTITIDDVVDDPQWVSDLYTACMSLIVSWMMIMIVMFVKRRALHPLSERVPWVVIITNIIFEIGLIDDLIAHLLPNHPWYFFLSACLFACLFTVCILGTVG